MSYVPAVILLMVIYMTSLVGFITPHQQTWYLYYTPYFILLNALLLGLYHKNWNKGIFKFIVATLSIGMFIEIIAVQSTVLYGNYRFGNSLGLQIMEVPLIMPIYWFILSYSTAIIVEKLPLKNQWISINIAAILMTGLSGLIQQVAAPLDFWYLEGTTNLVRYLSLYFGVGLGIQYLFQQLTIDAKNPIAIYVYGGLLVFFLGLLNFL